jgi:hypothetical protein
VLKRRQRISTLLLGGAQRKRARPRGFVPWSPRGTTQELLDQVQEVLDEYQEHQPLTIRQIFYRLVGAHGYEKTPQAYENLAEHLNRARRARMIPMDVIRDDGGTVLGGTGYESIDEFLESVRDDAKHFRLNRTAGQKTRLVVICEAAGMAPQLEAVAGPYDIKVKSGGGFDSVTEKHEFAQELTWDDRPTEVLHIGDHDPSGAHLFLAFVEDVRAFARGLGSEHEATFTRLAVTSEQIARYRLPTAPPKRSDRRAFRGQTCQAEALAPDDLATILRSAIEQRIDHAAYERVLRRELQVRRELLRRLKT